MHPRAEVDDRLVDYDEFVKAEGHITPASSSVMASYAMTIPAGEERWRAIIDLTTEFGVDVDDVSREVKRIESERSASSGLSQEVEHLSGGRKSSWQVRKERELGESRMRITKQQLRRIIREERARLLREESFTDSDRDPRMMSDKTANVVQLLQTVHMNLSEMDVGSAEDFYNEINSQLALIEDAIHALGGVV